MNSVSPPELANFKVGVDNVIFSIDTQQNRLLALLTKRVHPPCSGFWSLPGTLVRQGESLEKAAYRTLSELIRANNLYLEQLYTFGGPHRDPRESPESFGVRYLSVSYFALVRYEEAELISSQPVHRLEKVTGASDSNFTSQPSSPNWYMIEKIPELAFDHNQILAYGHQRLKSKLKYSPIAFDVLPELFTLNALYQFYVTILGENFSDYSNFRNKLLKLGFLRDTGAKVTKGAGRPASLYRFDAETFAPLKDKPLLFI